jgi:CubicO group peptidase (beta-lactamase class C family)
LLGELCAISAAQPFSDLLRDQVLKPMDLDETDYAPSSGTIDVVPGRRKDGRVVPAWHFDALAGAGGLVSSLHDLTRFVQVHLDPTEAWRAAVELCLLPRHRVNPRRQVGLAWHCDSDRISGAEIWWHNGATAGSRSFMAMLPEAGVGVVVLNNASPFDWFVGNIDQLGVEILRYAMKLTP